jgi:transcriptional regulator with XRE-family HTH domain
MLHVEAQLKRPLPLKRYRRKKQLSQREAAQKLSLPSPSILCRWEKGIGNPNLVNICKLLLLYQVSFEELYSNVLEELRGQITNK